MRAVALRAERKFFYCQRLGDDCVQLRRRAGVTGQFGYRVFGEIVASDERTEFQIGERLARLLGEGNVQRAILQGKVERNVSVDGCERTRKPRVLLVIGELLPKRGGTFVKMTVNAVQIAVRLQQSERALRPDSPYARDIIGRIAHERFQLHDLPRLDPLVFQKVIFRQAHQIAHAPLGKTHGHVIADELIGIAVSRIDERFHAAESLGERADQIVRLVPLFFDDTDFHGAEQIFEYRHLHDEFFGHRFARSLIVRIHFMAERRRVKIERHGKILRLFIVNDL